MKRWIVAIVGLVVAGLLAVGALVLVGRSALGREVAYTQSPALAAPEPTNAESAGGAGGAFDPQPQVQEGNRVTIEVVPAGLGESGAAVAFDIAMNTHSVDLSYDLAELATLRLDNGVELTPTSWDGGAGGHHVSGTLTFPVADWEGARSVELILREVADVPTWTFTWELP